MKTPLSLFALVTAFALIGCGGGGSGDTTAGNGTTTPTQKDPAPASVAGKTFNGRIGTTTTIWQIVFTGGGASGTYSYAENGKHLDSGSYTYTKTSPNSALLTLADGTTLQLSFNSAAGGDYLIAKSAETGTFTSN